MKPTVALTKIFPFVNLCEKTGVLANVHAGFVLSKKDEFLACRTKRISPTKKKCVFSAFWAHFWLTFRASASAFLGIYSA